MTTEYNIDLPKDFSNKNISVSINTYSYLDGRKSKRKCFNKFQVGILGTFEKVNILYLF